MCLCSCGVLFYSLSLTCTTVILLCACDIFFAKRSDKINTNKIMRISFSCAWIIWPSEALFSAQYFVGYAIRHKCFNETRNIHHILQFNIIANVKPAKLIPIKLKESNPTLPTNELTVLNWAVDVRLFNELVNIQHSLFDLLTETIHRFFVNWQNN